MKCYQIESDCSGYVTLLLGVHPQVWFVYAGPDMRAYLILRLGGSFATLLHVILDEGGCIRLQHLVNLI